jgi:glycosyltransferase involved in cell wall biosynthesis
VTAEPRETGRLHPGEVDATPGGPVVAILPWPDRFEDFHDRIGVTLDSYRREFTGSWLFNYVEALQRAGVRSVLYYCSARITAPIRFVHEPTGADVRVLPSPRLHQKVRGAAERFGVKSEVLRAVNSYLATPLRPLARAIRADRCGAILCQEYEYPRFDVAVGLGRLLRLPVFATFQGGEAPATRIETPLRRLAVRGAAGLIIASTEQAERARRRYGLRPDRIATIPNPVDVARWRPMDQAPARADLGISPGIRVVSWQGRVSVDQKGLDVLVEAWRRVSRAGRERSPLLLAVGHGEGAEELRRLLRTLPEGSVRWVDRFVHDRDERWRYLSAADVAVLPSRREGFPVAAVEAMACGLPVVAADALGVEDALGRGEEAAGIVVPGEDPEALAGALERLIEDDPLARELGARGRRRAEERFSLEAVGAQLRAFLLHSTRR